MARTLALDIGDRRIGVAQSDPTGILASPVTIIERATDEQAVADILRIVKEKDVVRIIAGLPANVDGSIGPQAQKVQAFIDLLRAQTSVPIDYRDERLTTVTAMRLKHESSTKKKLPHKTRYDAMAAAVILQDYLDETPRQESRT